MMSSQFNNLFFITKPLSVFYHLLAQPRLSVRWPFHLKNTLSLLADDGPIPLRILWLQILVPTQFAEQRVLVFIIFTQAGVHTAHCAVKGTL